MVQMIEANWPILVLALVVAIILLWWLLARSSKSTVRERRPDVLDEGAAPAQRNQALIDAPPAAAVMPAPIVPPPAGGTFGGIAEVIAMGAQAEAGAARSHEAADVTPESAPEAPAAAAPVAPVAPAPAPESGEADDLRRIKGVGPKLVTTLNALGITRYAQIASWTDADLDELDTKLGAFAGRPRRDAWVEQAQLLAGGDTAAYEARFGKL